MVKPSHQRCPSESGPAFQIRQVRQIKRATSHTFLRAGLRRLRTISHSQSPNDPNAIDTTRLPEDRALDLPPSTSGTSVPSVRLVQPLDSGPLPTYLAQLRGIHFVCDPSQEPDLDGDSTTYTSRSHSTKSHNSSAATPDGAPLSPSDTCSFGLETGDRSETGQCNCPTCNPATPTPSVLTESSQDCLSSPDNPDAQPTLSPRACLAAFPPIDLESPFAPYAPTPPLSPPSAPLSQNSVSTTPKAAGGFHLPRSLRRLPSTASIFKPSAKNPGPDIHQVSYQSSGILSMISQSTSSLKARSPSTSLETEESRTVCSPPMPSSAIRGYPTFESTPSFVSGISKCPSNGRLKWAGSRGAPRAQIATSETRFDQHVGCVPFPVSELCKTPQGPRLDDQRDRSLSAISPLRGGLNSLLLPISRIRTYSSLNTIFRSKKNSKSHLARQPPSEASSSFEAGGRTISISADSYCEVLDATMTIAVP